MALQESIYSDTTLSDFSTALLRANDTALLRANNKGQNLQFKGDKSVNISANDYTSPANRNLSSLLSQIQDDGPACSGSVKRDKFFNRAKNNNDTASGNQQDAGLNGDDTLPVSSSELQQGRRINADMSEEKTNIRTWNISTGFLFLLMLSAVALLALTLFKLDSRTGELEESLNLYDASMQDSIVSKTQSEDLSLSLTNTKKTLQSIQQELQLIKTDYEVLNEKYTESITNRISPQTDEATSIQDSVGALRYEILALKSELQTVKKKLIPTGEDENSTDKAVASSGLTVNLASLTNKNKAEKVVEQLHKAGLFPLIQQAVVKGKQVYRLSVSGFSNRDEAESFIRKAGEQYGMKDGWIRKS